MRWADLMSLTAVFLVGAGSAWGATITVNTTETSPFADGMCSLIEAIENANDGAVHSDCVAGDDGTDVIELGDNENYWLRESYHHFWGGNGLPPITSSVVINGHGSAIGPTWPPGDFRLMLIEPGGFAVVNDLTISNGTTETRYPGGGVLVLEGKIIMNRCSIVHNRTLGDGAGLANIGGTAVLVDSEVGWNNAEGGYAAGGLLNLNGLMLLVESAVHNGIGGAGGGIANIADEATTTEPPARLIIEGSVISENQG